MQFLVVGTGPQGLGKLGSELRERLALLLTGELRADVQVVALPSYAELLRAFGAGTIAVAWLPPGVLVEAHDKFGVKVLGRARRHGRASYRSCIFTQASSLISDLADLRGKSIGWVDPHSWSGYLFARLELADRGIDCDSYFGAQRFFGSHAGVAAAVEAGEVDAGTTFVYLDGAKAVHAGFSRLTTPMRRLLTTEPFPTDAVCALPSIGEDTCEQLAAALRTLHATEEGREVLTGLFQADSFEDSTIDDYAAVRRARPVNSPSTPPPGDG